MIIIHNLVATANDTPPNSETASQSTNTRSEKPSSSSTSLYPPSTRILSSLSPVRLTMNGSSSSTSPTSTCSSPVPHMIMDSLPGPSTNLTPPQSAPPQKIPDEFFPRTRSKSPGEMSTFQGGLTTKSNHFKRQSVGDWEIGSRDITSGQKIGSGSFGTVFKGTYFGMFSIFKLIKNIYDKLL